jgi:hypothetical protein
MLRTNPGNRSADVMQGSRIFGLKSQAVFHRNSQVASQGKVVSHWIEVAA